MRDYYHFGFNTFYQGAARSQAEWETIVKQLADEGQPLLASDLAKTALNFFPDSLKLKQTLARALTRVGALDEARQILEPLAYSTPLDYATFLKMEDEVRKALTMLALERETGRATPPDTLDALKHLLADALSAGEQLRQSSTEDEETLGLLARIYKDLWQQSDSPDDLRRCLNTYLRGFQASRGYYTGINAASMLWIAGQLDEARGLAREVLEICDAVQADANADDAYWVPATRGEAHLLLGNQDGAVIAYEQAIKAVRRKYAQIASSIQQLRLLARHGLSILPQLFNILKPPTVVVFTGHMIDHPNRATGRFPPELGPKVRQAIDEQLEALDARIGYSSAACGSDILFVEAMRARDAEVNIVLPFDTESFIKTSVGFADAGWVKRFREALALADSVKHVTTESYVGDELPFVFAGQLFQHYANIRARALETKPFLLAVWDGDRIIRPGGTASILSEWLGGDRERVRLIPLPPDRPALTLPSGWLTPPSEETKPSARVIKMLLFADVVKYSDLHEKDGPLFEEFLDYVSRGLRKLKVQPQHIATSGDEFFIVASEAMPLAEYALEFLRLVKEWSQRGQRPKISMRFALHAGSVSNFINAFTSQQDFHGDNVNRAARLQPVVPPNHIYATEEFTAMLEREQMALKRRVPTAPLLFEYEFVGTIPLAKNFGLQAVYHIRRRRQA